MIECEQCGKTFTPRKGGQRFCSNRCRDKFWNREKYLEAKRLRKEQRIRKSLDFHVY